MLQLPTVEDIVNNFQQWTTHIRDMVCLLDQAKLIIWNKEYDDELLKYKCETLEEAYQRSQICQDEWLFEKYDDEDHQATADVIKCEVFEHWYDKGLLSGEYRHKEYTGSYRLKCTKLYLCDKCFDDIEGHYSDIYSHLRDIYHHLLFHQSKLK